MLPFFYLYSSNIPLRSLADYVEPWVIMWVLL